MGGPPGMGGGLSAGQREVTFTSSPLGMTLAISTSNGDKPQVTAVEPNGNAARLGVQPGDIITEIRSNNAAGEVTGAKKHPKYQELMSALPGYVRV